MTVYIVLNDFAIQSERGFDFENIYLHDFERKEEINLLPIAIHQSI